jgi:hypothetical protein
VSELLLPGLDGTNPLAFLAALGTLDSLARGGRHATLRWTDDLVPQAMVAGADDLEDLLTALDADRLGWAESTVLRFPAAAPLPDAKPASTVLRDWLQEVLAEGRDTDIDLLAAIVAQGAFDRNTKAKPTHLHFTAGQQQFLDMARALAAEVDKKLLTEAVHGPWAYNSPLPSFSWDARGDRVYAVRATDPSKDKRLGVPGADWLAFRGLIFYPVSAVSGSLRTTACDKEWKRSAFRWPLWTVPASRDVVRSLVADETLVSQKIYTADKAPRARELAARGVSRVLESPIRRTDQGGYGSFGGPVTLASNWSGPDGASADAE